MPTIVNSKRFRAKCRTCNKAYAWQNTESAAEEDAERHQNNKPSHIVDIEEKTISHIAKRFRMK
jgi:hypothetical protein